MPKKLTPVQQLKEIKAALNLAAAPTIRIEGTGIRTTEYPMSEPERIKWLGDETLLCRNKISLLEECLSGFMLSGAINGMYISPEMATWAQRKLLAKTRTPVQVWQEIIKK